MEIPGVAHMIEDLINVLIVESKHLYNKIVHNIRQGHSAHAYDLMKNKGVREKCKWTRDNYKYKQMTMGVTDDIIAALKTNLSHARHIFS